MKYAKWICSNLGITLCLSALSAPVWSQNADINTVISAVTNSTIDVDSIPQEEIIVNTQISQELKSISKNQHIPWGFSTDLGLISTPENFTSSSGAKYKFEKQKFGDLEFWFSPTKKQTWRMGISGYSTDYKLQSDSAAKYRALDTLYAILGQKPLTNQYDSGTYFNSFANKNDIWYSDYTYDSVLAKKPMPSYQYSAYSQWFYQFSESKMGFGLHGNFSNISSAKTSLSFWSMALWNLAYFDLMIENSVLGISSKGGQKSNTITLKDQSQLHLIKQFFGVLYEVNSSINWQDFHSNFGFKISSSLKRFDWNLDGIYGSRELFLESEGRALNPITLDHQYSYGGGIGFQLLSTSNWRVFAQARSEKYTNYSRNIIYTGVNSSW
jgi:hypothetical protein